jgi:hypothetical protein
MLGLMFFYLGTDICENTLINYLQSERMQMFDSAEIDY